MSSDCTIWHANIYENAVRVNSVFLESKRSISGHKHLYILGCQ